MTQWFGFRASRLSIDLYHETSDLRMRWAELTGAMADAPVARSHVLVHSSGSTRIRTNPLYFPLPDSSQPMWRSQSRREAPATPPLDLAPVHHAEPYTSYPLATSSPRKTEERGAPRTGEPPSYLDMGVKEMVNRLEASERDKSVSPAGQKQATTVSVGETSESHQTPGVRGTASGPGGAEVMGSAAAGWPFSPRPTHRKPLPVWEAIKDGGESRSPAEGCSPLLARGGARPKPGFLAPHNTPETAHRVQVTDPEPGSKNFDGARVFSRCIHCGVTNYFQTRPQLWKCVQCGQLFDAKHMVIGFFDC